MPYSWLEEFFANLMMAGESKSEVEEVVISEDSNSQDASAEKIIREKTPQNSKSRLPPFNIPEKIVLCLDVTPACSKFPLYADKDIEPLLLLKQCVLIFINNKLSWSQKTEISVILLNGSSNFLYVPFTNNKKEIIDKIKRIRVPKDDGDSDMEDDLDTTYCLDELFKNISDNVELPESDNINVLPPYIVRCIFFYSRTKLLTFDPAPEYFKTLFSSPYFIFDSIFLHGPDLIEVVQTEVMKAMAELDRGYSYVLQSDNSVVSFMNTFALLASHPLQRPHQSEICSDVAFYRNKLLNS